MQISYDEGNVVLTEVRDFDLAQTLECGQCFHFKKLAEQEYAVCAFHRLLRIRQEKDSVILFDTTMQDYEMIWRDYFDFGRDYGRIKAALLQTDDTLKEAVETMQGVHILQQEFFESKKKLKELARKHVLPFHRFLAIIFDADIPLDFNRKEVFVSFLRSRYIMNLRQRMEEELEYGSQVNEEQLIVFIDSFVKLTTEQTMEFFQRICPCEKIDSGLEGCLRLASEEKINTLFNQINSLEVLIPDGLHWVQEEKKQTPSTLGADRNVRQFCVRIFNNAANLDMLREYDQIIGCVTDSVENIRECVYNIKHSDIEKDPNNIFEINKIGILKLEDRIRS